MRALAVIGLLAICHTAPAAAGDKCQPLHDIIAENLPDVDYEVIPFGLVADLVTIYNAIPPLSTENFDGAVVRVTHEQAIILLTRGADVCGNLPSIPAPRWAVLHKRIFGVMA